MDFSKYTDAIKRLNTALSPIAEHYKKPKAYFWADALWANIRYGVTPNQYLGFHVYEKSALERAEFYTRRQHYKFEKELNNPEYYETFWNKAIFNRVFADYVKRDWIYCPDEDENKIRSFIDGHSKMIVKPTSLSSGRGIHVFREEIDNIHDLIVSKALLEEYVIQHKNMMALNPSSVNTVRIYTILDKENNPHILSASLRVGGQGSEVDNYHGGGVGYPIDPDHGVVMGAGTSIAGERYLYHPGTEVRMIGFEIPNWQELKEFTFSATQVIPSARMIAWDVAVLENGFEMIEANYNGDPGFMQAPSNTGKLKEIKKYK